MRQNTIPFHIKGMNQDSLYNQGDFSFENKNIRFLKESTSMNTLINEKGLSPTEEQYLKQQGGTYYMDTMDIEIEGNVLGYKTVKDYLILIAKLGSTGKLRSDNENRYPYIIMVYKNVSNDTNSIAEWALSSYLYTDKLDKIEESMYIEINADVENDILYKIYISSNNLECPIYYFYIKEGIINGRYDEYGKVVEDYIRDLNSEYIADSKEINSFCEGLILPKDTGALPSGTVQYFIVRAEESGNISAVLWQSAILYVSNYNIPNTEPNTIIPTSFKLSFTESKDSDYYCYVLHRTSLGTLDLYNITSSKKVEESGIPYDNRIEYTDSLEYRESLSSDYIQQLLKYNLRYKTATTKDAVYIAGNITTDNVQVQQDLLSLASDISIEHLEITYKEVVGNSYGSSRFGFDTTQKVYDRTSQLFSSVERGHYNTNRYFHSREVYRFGIQLQNKYGQYTNVIYIGDKYIDEMPYVRQKWGEIPGEKASLGYYFKVPIVQISSKNSYAFKKFLTKARKLGYIGIRPVVVFPTINNRLTIFQGAVNPTIFNMASRLDNTLYAQASYLWRPIVTQDLMYGYARYYEKDSKGRPITDSPIINHSKSYMGRFFQTRNRYNRLVNINSTDPREFVPTDIVEYTDTGGTTHKIGIYQDNGNPYPPKYEIKWGEITKNDRIYEDDNLNRSIVGFNDLYDAITELIMVRNGNGNIVYDSEGNPIYDINILNGYSYENFKRAVNPDNNNDISYALSVLEKAGNKSIEDIKVLYGMGVEYWMNKFATDNSPFNYYFGCRPSILPKYGDEEDVWRGDVDNNLLNAGDVGYQFPEYRHYHVIPDGFKFNGEIDYSPNDFVGLSIACCNVGKYRSLINNYRMKSMHCVDTSIVTLHSPDLYYTDLYDNLDYSVLRFRLIGTIPITGYSSDREVVSENAGDTTSRFNKAYSHHYHKNNYGPTACGYSMNIPAWEDRIYKTGSAQPSNVSFKYPIPIFKSPELSNSPETSLLKYQLQSHFHYSPFSIYYKKTFEISGENEENKEGNNSYSSYIGKNSREDIQIFNSNSPTILLLNINGNQKPYSGNVDTIITSTLPSGIPIWSKDGDSSTYAVYDRKIGIGLNRYDKYSNMSFLDDEKDTYKTKKTGVSVKYKTTKHAVITIPMGYVDEEKTSLGLPFIDISSLKYNTIALDKVEFLNDYAPELNSLLSGEYDNSILGSKYRFPWDETISRIGARTVQYDTTTIRGTNGYNIGDSNFKKSKWTNPLCYITEGYYYNPSMGDGEGEEHVAFGGFLYLGEIYRDKPSNISTVFGGTSPDVLQTHIWRNAGISIPLTLGNIESENGCIIQWTEGDTYYTRFTNIKTYPFTEEDQNQIVDTLSFMCESRVNTDAVYNTLEDPSLWKYLRPHKNFLLNLAYTQEDLYLPGVYVKKNVISDTYSDVVRYPHSIVWSIPKLHGEYTDPWLNLSPVNMLDLDGKYGEIKRLINFKNNIIAFQEHGISVIYYNDREVVTTQSGNSLTIANSTKIDKYEYISTLYGLQHHTALAVSESYIYFIDHSLRKLLRFDGSKVEDIGLVGGMSSWLDANLEFSTVDTYGINKTNGECTGDSLYYNKIMKEIYLINNKICLCFSENLGTFTSFYSYEKLSGVFNSGDNTYFINNYRQKDYSFSNILEQFKGEYNTFSNLEVNMKINDPVVEYIEEEGIVTPPNDYSDFKILRDEENEIVEYRNNDYKYGLPTILPGNKTSYTKTTTSTSIFRKTIYVANPYFIEFICSPEFADNNNTSMFIFEDIKYINEVYDEENNYLPNHTYTHIGMQIPYEDKIKELTEIHYSTYGSSFTRKLDPTYKGTYHTFRSNAQKKFGVWNVKLPRPNLRIDAKLDQEGRVYRASRVNNRFSTNYAAYPWIKIKLYNDGKLPYKSVLHDIKVDYYNI